MAFYFSYQTFISFATYDDLVQRDQRLFEANENLTQTKIDDFLKLAAARILTQIRNTDWWRGYAFGQDSALQRDLRLLPSVNPSNIKSRETEFKDLNIYFAFHEYILPYVADFGNPESAEVQKINHYRDQYNKLFTEVIESGDWYDFDADGTIETAEKSPNKQNLVRIR
jgi:hypothetical protein